MTTTTNPTAAHARANETPVDVVVTGAGGFIGLPLIQSLLKAGHRVRAVTREPAVFRKKIADTIDLNQMQRLSLLEHPGFARDADWKSILAGAQVLVHGAGIAHVALGADRGARRQLWRVNVQGTRQLAREAADAGVKRLIFLSSIKAAGERSAPGEPLQADAPPQPEDCYGYAKLAGERHLLKQHEQHPGMDITIIRPPLVYGPGVKANFAALMKLARSGLPLPLGSIRNERSFLSVHNLADAILRVIAEPQGGGNGVFHLSDGVPVSTPGLIRNIARASGKPARLLPIPPALLGAVAKAAGQNGAWQRLAGSLAVDHRPFCRQFNWQPPLTMAEALAAMHGDNTGS